MTAIGAFFARFVVVLTLALCLPFWPAGAGQASAGITVFEREHVEHLGTVRFCVDPDWPPFEWVDQDGRYRGIAADLIALVAARTGLQLELFPTRDWSESVEAARDGRCSFLGFLNRTPAREKWLLFTEPLFSDPNVVITREEHDPVGDLADLAGQTIALPEGTSIEERVRRDYPALVIVLTKSEDEAMQMVSERRADLTLRSLIVAAYTIKKQGLFNLKIAGRVPDYTNHLRMAVSSGDGVLRDILDKGVVTLTDEERDHIVNAYVTIKVEAESGHGLMLGLAALLALFSLGSLVVVWRLFRSNRELSRRSRIDALTGLFSRSAIEARLQAAMARGRRTSQPAVAVMLDIDHFKAVNDDFGHATGDRVLAKVGAVIAACVRGADSAGRYGGEEFVVFCPGSALDAGFTVAERIRQTMESTDFGLGHPLTISAGVALWRPGEAPAALLDRADGLLYDAKHGGRNRTVIEVTP